MATKVDSAAPKSGILDLKWEWLFASFRDHEIKWYLKLSLLIASFGAQNIEESILYLLHLNLRNYQYNETLL